jgi:N-acetylglucosamine kinase-like BadF-type ATPase
MTEYLDQYLRGRAEAWETAAELISDMVAAGNTPEQIQRTVQAIALQSMQRGTA